MEFVDKSQLVNVFEHWKAVEEPNEGEIESKVFWAVNEALRVINEMPTIAVDITANGKDQELIELAKVIKKNCEEHDLYDCKVCPFNNGYGLKGCKLEGEPEVWKI